MGTHLVAVDGSTRQVGFTIQTLEKSSAASTNNTMDNKLLLNGSNDLETLTSESSRLLNENTKLRKLMGLIQENLELRSTLKDHERKARSLHRGGQQQTQSQDTGEEAPPSSSTTKPTHLDPDKVKQCQRIVGEIAFQLDRRILCAVFAEQQRLYGYQVANIKEKILQVATCPLTGTVDDSLRSELTRRYHHTMKLLKKMGYDRTVHPNFTEYLINTYGIMKDRTAGSEDIASFNDPQFLNKMITEYMPSHEVEDILVILKCLAHLAKEDGKCLFPW